MDEGLLNDLLECSVCLDRLDTSSRVLPCQHTFCMKCLKVIVEAHKELRCPECRVLVAARLEDLPPNVLLMRILEGMRAAAPRRLHVSATLQEQSTPVAAVPAGPAPADASPRPASKPAPPHARALYDYVSKEPSDLSFKKGDVIFLLKKLDPCWHQGECGGRRGLFPITYVQVLVALPAALCRALYDFRMSAPDDDGCLAFDKGAIISVQRRVDENWAEGRLENRVGIFPIAFVELNHWAALLVHSAPQQRPPPAPPAAASPAAASPAAASPAADTRLHAQPTPRHRASLDTAPGGGPASVDSDAASPHAALAALTLADPVPPVAPPALSVALPARDERRRSLPAQRVPAARHSLELLSTSLLDAPAPPSPAPTAPASRVRRRSAERAPRTYVALYAYTPQRDDELPLQRGALYSVTERCRDGWYKAVSRGGRRGVLPGNYVAPAPSQKSVSPAAGEPATARVRPDAAPDAPPRRRSPPRDAPAHYGAAPLAWGSPPAAPPAVPPAAAAPAAAERTKDKAKSEKAGGVGAAGASLMKRLAAMKRARSPPPAAAARYDLDNPVFDAAPDSAPRAHHAANQHVRSGSCPSQLLRSLPAPRAAPPPAPAQPPPSHRTTEAGTWAATHRKSQSLDAAPRREKHSAATRERYRVVAPYPALGAHELELRVDDIVLVSRKRSDGWFRGTVQGSARSGLFPASFVASCRPA